MEGSHFMGNKSPNDPGIATQQQSESHVLRNNETPVVSGTPIVAMPPSAGGLR